MAGAELGGQTLNNCRMWLGADRILITAGHGWGCGLMGRVLITAGRGWGVVWWVESLLPWHEALCSISSTP